MVNSKLIRRERCPKCAEEGRDTSEDNLGVYDDGHVYCFSCQYYSPTRSLVGDRLDGRKTYTYEFLPWRNITKKTFQTFGSFTKINSIGAPVSIGFKYPNGDYKVRLIDKKEFYWVKGGSNEPNGLFGQDKFTPGSHKYVTITEGELDALSLHQVLGSPVVSVSSATAAVRDCTHSRSWLNSYERIYLAFDNDTNGRSATAAVARLFDRDKVFQVKFTHRKDANDYLLAGEEQELKKIWWNSKKYLPENIVSSLEDFAQALRNPPKLGAPYPFEELTKRTYGIRTGEVVLITAQEKVGKTEFTHAILHSLLKERDDATNVAGLFHEENLERTLQALAGVELRRPVHLPDSGVTQVEITEAVRSLVKRDDRLYLHTYSGDNDPKTILDTIRFLAAGCGCKYVIWDHPGMVVFGMGDDKERQTLDYLAAGGEALAKELDFSLIVVYHVNDMGQIRGSRYPGKVCDVRIDLTRDTAAADAGTRNILYVTIPYIRFGSNSGPVGAYTFDPYTQQYTEVNANDNYD